MNIHQKEAVGELIDIMDELQDLSRRASNLVSDQFPNESHRCDAYKVFDFGSSCNPYDVTLEKIISEIRSEEDECVDDD
jgi:hypothetical protein